MTARRAATTTTVSPLRQARQARAQTLEQVCADLDQQSASGTCGITPSMLSGWELGRHVTSARSRRILAAFYGQPTELLFAHQDAQLAVDDQAPRLLVGHRELYQAMTDVVRGACRYLVLAGSRSRNAPYLQTIEDTLAARPDLVHYRVLFGPPQHQILHDHLLRLLTLRDPNDRSLGPKTLHLGIIDDTVRTPERFLCVSEQAAVVPIPSLTSAEGFDSGLLLGPRAAERYIDHVRQCYAGARRVETVDMVHALPIVHPRSTGPDRPGMHR
ncbi:MAG: helix-turn-helix domain-containing protein [Dactylosporangium sp.]|nr:helix-turn-helix domain-containing protein [Dactylosporangium sp.]